MPADGKARLAPEAVNGSNMLELRVYGMRPLARRCSVARLDNLGKARRGRRCRTSA
jgi:N-acetyl-gamma-glutamyl-phosphate reductase